MRYTFIIIISILLLSSCTKNSKNKSKIDEGIIVYDVSYFASEKENPIITLLPDKVELRFKENNISLSSEGYLGFFSTKFISSYNSDKSHILLKVLNNKYNYEFPKDEVAFIYNQLPPHRINYLDKTKNIAGYDCKLAEVFFEENIVDSIIVAYTEDIGLANPNRNTPLHEIKGVLLEFEITMNQIRTKFTAKNVSLEETCSDDFIIPDDYILSNKDSLKKYLIDFN